MINQRRESVTYLWNQDSQMMRAMAPRSMRIMSARMHRLVATRRAMFRMMRLESSMVSSTNSNLSFARVSVSRSLFSVSVMLMAMSINWIGEQTAMYNNYNNYGRTLILSSKAMDISKAICSGLQPIGAVQKL